MDPRLILAKSDFQRARQQAIFQTVISRLTGKPTDLLLFDEVRQKLKAIEGTHRELKPIPLDAIVGTVGRYQDFNRQFLPTTSSSEDRWARVKVVMESSVALDPIEVYQLGEAYFVIDGNHRVSIAHQMGFTEIEAFVRTVRTRVPFPANAAPEDLILLAEYADFLEQTRLDELRPRADLRLTAPGHYGFLLQQIEVQHFLMELSLGGEVSYQDAVCQWYDGVYLPLVEMIRTRNLLEKFPTRTEADFFVWLLDHQAQLSSEVGWRIQPEAALDDLIAYLTPGADSPAARLQAALVEALAALRGRPVPPAGQWREDRLRSRPGRLFADVLAVFSDEQPYGWAPLEGALQIARHEGARVFGVCLSPKTLSPQQTENLHTTFLAACQEAGVEGRVIVQKGKGEGALARRTRWADLVILPTRPAGSTPVGRLLPFAARSYAPVLALPGPFTFPRRALLMYDGSQRADEALFLAAYLAAFWEVELAVLAPAQHALAQATQYLAAYQIEATALPARQDLAAAVREHACDLILMGGIDARPGKGKKKTGEQAALAAGIPVLVCR